MDYKRQREEVVKVFEVLQSKLVELLEENINERPLHQLSLSEFNLHQEAKKERLKAVRNFKRHLVQIFGKNGEIDIYISMPNSICIYTLQAEKEREEIRLHTEARIRAQDKVTAWIKQTCWDTIQTPRIKLFAIFSHYHVNTL